MLLFNVFIIKKRKVSAERWKNCRTHNAKQESLFCDKIPSPTSFQTFSEICSCFYLRLWAPAVELLCCSWAEHQKQPKDGEAPGFILFPRTRAVTQMPLNGGGITSSISLERVFLPVNLGGFHPSFCSFKALGSAQLMQLLLLEANFWRERRAQISQS